LGREVRFRRGIDHARWLLIETDPEVARFCEEPVWADGQDKPVHACSNRPPSKHDGFPRICRVPNRRMPALAMAIERTLDARGPLDAPCPTRFQRNGQDPVRRINQNAHAVHHSRHVRAFGGR
jgi:hypothetical protein